MNNKVLQIVFLSSRAKSFYWRSGSALVLGFLAYLLGVLPDLELSEYTLAISSLLLGEVTKAVNNYFTKKAV